MLQTVFIMITYTKYIHKLNAIEMLPMKCNISVFRSAFYTHSVFIFSTEDYKN